MGRRATGQGAEIPGKAISSDQFLPVCPANEMGQSCGLSSMEKTLGLLQTSHLCCICAFLGPEYIQINGMAPRFRRLIWSQEKLMKPLLEMDFAMQQQTLRRLRDQRKNLPNGSEDAVDSEVEIIAAENLILSYETLKYYELEQPVRTIDGA
jgi:hypothetical protein